MANILVNGLKSKVGGGKVIFDTYLRLLIQSEPRDRYFILTPDRAAYAGLETDNIRIIDVPGWAHSNLSTLPLYRFVFPLLLRRYRIDAILNFGDIIVPTKIHQVYNFDWPHAVYPEQLGAMSMGRAERVLYAVKLHFFEAYLPRASVIMAQTHAMKGRLEERYGLKNVVLVPAAVSSSPQGGDVQRFPLPDDRRFLVYPANYYPHKNIDVLEEVAALLKQRGSDIGIVTTLDPDEHPAAAAFLERIASRGLGDVLVNVGRLPASRVPALYRASSGLLMPTLLETFGLPYVEAMQHGRPILTSDRDFAKSVCGDAAAYFDPESPSSIVSSIEGVLGDQDARTQLIERGSARLRGMWDWQRVFAEYQRLLSGRPESGDQRLECDQLSLRELHAGDRDMRVGRLSYHDFIVAS